MNNHASTIAYLIIAVILLLAAAAVIFLTDSLDRPTVPAHPITAAPETIGPDQPTSWPMFHHNPALTGATPGHLPDQLTMTWKASTQGPVKASPVIDQGLVFIGSTDSHFYAFDLVTGREVWTFKTDAAIEGSACVVDHRVFVGSSDASLYCLDTQTGRPQWSYQTGGKILGSVNTGLIPDPCSDPCSTASARTVRPCFSPSGCGQRA